MTNRAHPRPRLWLALTATLAIVASVAASSAAHAQTDEVVITGVTPVAGITVPNGTSLDGAIDALPPTTTITVSEGDPLEVALDWRLQEVVELSRGGTAMQHWFPTARGAYQFAATFDLPDGVGQPDPPIDLEVTAIVTIAAGPLVTIDDDHILVQPGTYVSDSITFGTITRTFHYYVPTSYDPAEPTPVMITLHGAGSYGLGQMVYSQFDRVAEENGFIVVAPDYGISALGLFLVPGIASFSDTILDRLGEQYSIDERRVYASGISMGGASSLTLGRELSHRIAAIAPVAIGISSLITQDLPRPMTVVAMYGTYDSGWGPSFFEAIEAVADHIGAGGPEVTTWPATPDDHTSINRHAYTGGIYGTEAIFYEVVEGGHTWPGTYQYASLLTVGPTTQHVQGSEEIWSILSRHSLPMEATVDVRLGAVNPASRGVIPVAVLSTDELDATTVELDTVRFGPTDARPVGSSVEDVDGDGRADLVLRFRTQDTGIQLGDHTAELSGRAVVGGAFHGSDTVRTVPTR